MRTYMHGIHAYTYTHTYIHAYLPTHPPPTTYPHTNKKNIIHSCFCMASQTFQWQRSWALCHWLTLVKTCRQQTAYRLITFFSLTTCWNRAMNTARNTQYQYDYYYC